MARAESCGPSRLLLLAIMVVVGSASCGSEIDPDAEVIRATERDRLRALVQADVERARRLHADDFQLINPLGEALSKEQYLRGIESGEIDYLVWEADSPIDVRVHGESAVIRYQSKLEIVVQGQMVPLGRYWHTDSYEKRDGRWQVVWSQATQIR